MPDNQDALYTERKVGGRTIEEIPAGVPSAQAHEIEEERPVVETPLPKLQLFILLYIQLAEPITSTVIYPFVNQQVRKTGITGGNDDKTSYFAGLIVSGVLPCADVVLRLTYMRGILLLRHRSHLRTPVGSCFRSSWPKAHYDVRASGPYALNARIRFGETVLGTHLGPLR